MKESVKGAFNSLKNSPIGAIAGAVAGFYGNKKFLKSDNKLVIGLCVVAGALVGAAVEYKIKAVTVKPAIAAAKK